MAKHDFCAVAHLHGNNPSQHHSGTFYDRIHYAEINLVGAVDLACSGIPPVLEYTTFGVRDEVC